MRKKLFVIFIVAFLFRLIALNQSLWLDEATTARVVQQYNYAQIITKFSPSDFHPPLFYIFMKAWSNIFGYAEVVLRMPSVLFSLSCGYIVYVLYIRMSRDRSRRAPSSVAKWGPVPTNGLFAVIFFLFNPLIIYYSQEARMYMMVTFLLSVSLYYFMVIITSKSLSSELRATILFNLFTALSFLTFYGSIFMIAAYYIVLLWKRQFALLIKLLPGFVIALLVVTPLLYQQFLHSREALQIVTNWKAALGPASLKNLFLIPLKFSLGRISFEPKNLYYLLSLPWTLFILFIASRGIVKQKLFGVLCILPVFLGLVFSFFSPLLQYFRFLYLLPILSILLANSYASQRQLIKLVLATIVLLGFAGLSCMYVLNPVVHRENWRDAALSVNNKKEIYMIVSSSDPIRYYGNKSLLKDLRTLSVVQNLPDKIVVIPYTSDIYGYDYKTNLINKGYASTSIKNFRGVTVEEWQRIKQPTN
jgi:4-amino-4-deoxy-L-arabinose transferase-like glycosyltransferase